MLPCSLRNFLSCGVLRVVAHLLNVRFENHCFNFLSFHTQNLFCDRKLLLPESCFWDISGVMELRFFMYSVI